MKHLAIILCMLLASSAHAENKVVVIPLGGSDVPDKVLSQREIIQSPNYTMTPGATSSGPANCPSGKVPIGGGFARSSSDGTVGLLSGGPLVMVSSYPQDHPSVSSWVVVVHNPTALAHYFRAYAICVNES